MNIILFPSSYYPVLGGLQEAVSQLAREFSAQGHQVLIITNRYPRSLKKMELIQGLRVQRMLFPGFFLESLVLSRIGKYLIGLFCGMLNLGRLLCLFLSEHPDVINVHFLGAQAPFALLASRILGLKCIISLHGDDVEGLPHRSRIDYWLFRKTLAASDHVTACSSYLLNEALKLFPAIKSRSTCIHNGIRPEEFLAVPPFKHIRTFIFAAGRFVHKKGFDLLLRAYRIALDKGLTADLIVAGDGPEKKTLVAVASALGLSFVEKLNWNQNHPAPDNLTIFWGRASSHEMMALLNGCEVFVVPSRKEPFGIVALEALAAGKKVVAFRTGGLPEILNDGKRSQLVDPENIQDMADAIMLTVNAKNTSTVQNFRQMSWQAASAKYLSVFGALTSK